MLGEADPGSSPEIEWSNLETEVLKDDPHWQQKIADPKQNAAVYRKIDQGLTIQCERLARSLSRLFTIGGLGQLARQISSYTHHFLFLMDDQLGQTDYEKVRI